MGFPGHKYNNNQLVRALPKDIVRCQSNFARLVSTQEQSLQVKPTASQSLFQLYFLFCIQDEENEVRQSEGELTKLFSQLLHQHLPGVPAV